MDIKLIVAFFVSLATVLLITPLVIKLAIKIGATDKPNYRKVHEKVMPRMGGLAIFAGVFAGYLASGLYSVKITGISLGAVLIIILGILDDMYELSAKVKFLSQIVIALMIVATGLTIDYITIPFVVEKFELGWLSFPLTIFWIVGITNAINLIDGLDGLAAGISSIAIATLAVMAGMADKALILTLCLIVLGSTIGFLFYNFNPAKIFMGDTGALFLGYCISILSLLGLYKSVTLFSFLIPIIILGVPVFDTTYAIIRRVLNKQPISAPDKGHLHHRLLALGFSHRNTVLLIYGLGILFSISAILLSSATLWGTIIIIFGLLIFLHLVAEVIGIVNEKYKPLVKFYRKVFGKQL
ncbi:glycosyltransferase family 4 protein [Metabacillus bambusae]|uniref:Undecaprenyl/decaprenyl-phosphate alpha-N-acetylglucosaminyl 1-phosphate transferase n=1 Tax=Metabacillus bambusae TaxID=2795218 RepID=A0ABS3N0S3_9BACI|nr:MraY family glycosyltransferase [Metabacillus bambusae]MBO1511760.1 undecaprenyl/decaprenyl-phosphate alpha-N-acetylglucosaminyl 1-phosphate transferase [Metabacillus bambusae]